MWKFKLCFCPQSYKLCINSRLVCCLCLSQRIVNERGITMSVLSGPGSRVDKRFRSADVNPYRGSGVSARRSAPGTI